MRARSGNASAFKAPITAYISSGLVSVTVAMALSGESCSSSHANSSFPSPSRTSPPEKTTTGRRSGSAEVRTSRASASVLTGRTALTRPMRLTIATNACTSA